MIFKLWSKPLRTKRLVLRPFTPGDYEAWAAGQLHIIAKLESACPASFSGSESCPTGFIKFNSMEFKANHYQSPCL